MIAAGMLLAGRYKVQNYVDEGGMQRVYAALDTRLDQVVAIKTPLENQKHRRFQKSALISAKISHHNIAKTYDYFEEDEVPYLVEEFVVGHTLDQAVLTRSDFIDPHLAAKVFHQLSRGLAASHRAGVIHRDLKPSNVMICGGYNLSEIKITDFGIATLTKEFFEEEIGDEQAITNSTSGTVRGALPYMSPEMMFRTNGGESEAAMDIWSLGAMMFKMMTGRFPFGVGFNVPANVKTNSREDWPAFLTSKNQFEPLSRSLMHLVEKCLNYEPKDRPSAEQLVSECGDICYFSAPRVEGTVNNMPCRSFGFFNSPQAGGRVFAHQDSVYGPNRLQTGLPATFSYFPGHPQARAHPVLILKK